MKKILNTLFCCFMLTACGEQATPPEPPSAAIFVLLENGGSISEEDQHDASDTALNLLQQLTDLQFRKATRDTQINLVLTTNPNKITWSGTPEQLAVQALQVKELIAFRQTFSDLVMAYEQIETTIAVSQPDQVGLYHIGPFIHVPFQSTDDPIDISLPQDVPGALALPRFLNRLSVLRYMNVHDDQDMVLFTYLTSIGLNSRVGNGELNFSLRGKAQTQANLTDLL